MDRSAVDLINQNYNINCTVQNGAMSTSTNGGVVWIASEATPEMCKVISAGSVDSGTHNQPLTVSCHLFHIFGSMMFQGGSSGGLYLDANAVGASKTPGWPFVVPAYGSSNPSGVIYGWLWTGSQVNANLPVVGGMISSFTAPNNGFHIYKVAPVIYTTNQGSTPVLGINDVTWAPGDFFEEAPNASFALTAVNIQLGQQSPIGPFGGGNVAITGFGANLTTGYTMLDLDVQNAFGMYAACDNTSSITCLAITGTPGWAQPPDMINFGGPFRNALIMGAPLQSVITVNDTGGSQYGIFDDSSQVVSLSVDITHDRFVIGAATTLATGNLTVGANITANTGGFTNLVFAQNAIELGSAIFSAAPFGVTLGGIGAYPQPSDALFSAGSLVAGTGYVGAKPVSFAAAATVEGTTGSNTCAYTAYGQTPNGFSVASSPVSTSSCNNSAMGTGSAVTNASIQLIANNPGVVLTTAQSCTAGQFLVAYGL